LKADDADGRPVPLVLTTGELEENRRLFREHGVAIPVLVQKEGQIATLYHANGTPMGYLIDEEGRLASPLAVGAEALLALAAVGEEPPADQGVPLPQANRRASRTRSGKANRGLAASRINRDGLKAGAAAPPFRLPRLDGGEVTLEEFRGQRLLLVFSDPKCGPCDELAPRLEQFHRNIAEPRVLVVSRGDPDANRAKAAHFELTFPICLQKQWEISLRYGMFATPIAYLIDDQGILITDVAVGVDPVLALTSEQMEDKTHEALVR
jgi:peroxiredoxin